MDVLKQKLLSQNFLHNKGLVKMVVHNSSISNNDTVIEIGPGIGIITEELLHFAKKVIAVEIDKKYYKDLINRLRPFNNLEVVNSDFLTFQTPNILYKVFSNIPFRMTGEIIKKLLRSSNPPEDSFLIVQKEAAEKLLANNLISILYQPWFEFCIVHHFKKTDFSPVPNVDIVLLRIQKRKEPLLNTTQKELFEDFIAYVHSQKKPCVVRITSKLSQISLSEWIKLFNDFARMKNDIKIRRIKGSAIKLFSEQEKLQKIHRTRTDKKWRDFREIRQL